MWRQPDYQRLVFATTGQRRHDKLSASRDGSLVLNVSRDRDVAEVWETNLSDAQELHLQNGDRQKWHYLCPREPPNPILVCVTPANNLLRVFAEEFVFVRMGESVPVRRPTEMRVERAFASSDQEFILVAAGDGRSRILRTDNLETVSELKNPPNDVEFAAFSDDSERICLFGDQKLGVWHVKTGRTQRVLELESSEPDWEDYVWLAKHDLILMRAARGWGGWSTKSGKRLLWPDVTPWPEVFCLDASHTQIALAYGQGLRVLPLYETQWSAKELRSTLSHIVVLTPRHSRRRS